MVNRATQLQVRSSERQGRTWRRRDLSGLRQGHLPIDRTMVPRRLIRPFSCAQTILSCATLWRFRHS